MVATRSPMLDVLRQFRILLRSMEAHYREVESRSGLGGAQLWALAEIEAAGELSVGDLAQRLAIHLSTASNLVRRLEALGLVSRRRGAGDQRIVCIEVTPSGRRKLREAPKPPVGLLQKALMEMESGELRALARQLERVLGHMSRLEHRAGASLISEMLSTPGRPGSSSRIRR